MQVDRRARRQAQHIGQREGGQFGRDPVVDHDDAAIGRFLRLDDGRPVLHRELDVGDVAVFIGVVAHQIDRGLAGVAMRAGHADQDRVGGKGEEGDGSGSNCCDRSHQGLTAVQGDVILAHWTRGPVFRCLSGHAACGEAGCK